MRVADFNKSLRIIIKIIGGDSHFPW